MSIKKTIITGTKAVLLNAACLGFMAAPALAQDDEEVVVVTGFRASLASSTAAKRDSTNFTDSVFAEDIGQFPDTNIAESLNRIPGIQLSREVNGEGLSIAIRGLGTNFTKVLLNGTQISVASSGSFDSQNTNRELDLDLFPTELFNRLDVNKSPVASVLEGGVSGTVNLRSARPFDNPGTHLTYSLQGQYLEYGEEWAPRGALIGSWSNDTFGVLAGVQVTNSNIVTRGYETIGFTNFNFSPAQCTLDASSDAPCDALGGNGMTIPATVPAHGPSGLTPGAPINAAFLTANNPGTTLTQLGEGVLPRLGRPAHFDGTRDRQAALISLQWRPTDGIDVYLDMMGAMAQRDINRRDIMWEVRNSNFMIPMNVEVDANNVITRGTFANSRFFLEARPYEEDLEFYNINPGASFQFGDNLHFDIQANLSRSVFFREQPTIGLTTDLLDGIEVDYDNTGGDVPVFNSSVDLNDPDAGWVYIRLNLQNEKRVTDSQGMHWDVLWGDERNNLRAGVAYDEVGRTIIGLNNDANWENFTCREGYDPITNTPNPRPGCTGATSASAIPQSALASYLFPGAGGFVDVDYDRFKADSNYESFFDTAPGGGGAATGASSGLVDEETLGAYLEANGEVEWMDHVVRFNAGARYVTTDQTISSYVVQPEGGREFTDTTYATYDAFLPAFNVVADVMDDVTLRMSASRTLTRANPNAMLPNTTFSDPSAQQANQGNPNLSPFLSNNVDFGGEWYTGGEGYFGFALFRKDVTGFTVTGTNTVPFLSLGIDYDDLSETQQIAIDNRGGPNVATVIVNQQVNANGVLTINGYELTWVQPLDIVLDGLGFTANYTRINQQGSGSGVPAIATGVSPVTYAFTGYYENFGFSGRVSYVWNDEQRQNQSPQDGLNGFGGQQGLRFTEARGQWDASFRYTFDAVPSTPQVTLDLINITNEPRREYQGFENALYRFYDPGYTVLLGVRGTF